MSGFQLDGDVEAIRHQANLYGSSATQNEATANTLIVIGNRAADAAGKSHATDSLKKAMEREAVLLQTAKDKYREAQSTLNHLADYLSEIRPKALTAYQAPCKEPGIFDFLVHGKTYPDYQHDARSAVAAAAQQIAGLARSPEYMNRGPTAWDAIASFFSAYGDEAKRVGGDIVDSVASTVTGLYTVGKFVFYDADPLTGIFRPQELIDTYAQTGANLTAIINAAQSDPHKFWTSVWEAVYNKQLLDKDPAAWFAVSYGSVLLAALGAAPAAAKATLTAGEAATRVGSLIRSGGTAVKDFLTANSTEMGATGRLLSSELKGVEVYSVKPGSEALKAFDSKTLEERWGANSSPRGYGGENAFSALYKNIVPSYRPAISNQEGIDGLATIDGKLTVSQVKTIDPTAPSYQQPSQFYNTLKSYMDKLNAYDSGAFKDVNGGTMLIRHGAINSKQLVIGVPDLGLDASQVAKLKDLVALTKTEQYSNIDIVMMEIPR